jgi:hypothetical protein
MYHLFKLRLYLKPYTWQVLLNITFLLSVTGLSLVVPQILQNVIDQGLRAGAAAFLVRSALLLRRHGRPELGPALPDRMDRGLRGLRLAQCHVRPHPVPAFHLS